MKRIPRLILKIKLWWLESFINFDQYDPVLSRKIDSIRKRLENG